MEWRPVKTQRGSIYADDGESLLATSVEFFEIRMDPFAPSKKDFYENIDGLSASLAEFPGGKTASEWKNVIVSARNAYIQKKKGGTRNLLIAKEVDHVGLERLKKMPLFNLGQYRGGMIKRKIYVREKPYRELASRTIGIHRDQNQVGLENSFDHLLKGEEKKMKMRFIPPDLWVSVYDPTDYQIIKGADLVTNINIPLQDVVHNELREGILAHQATGGTAVLMDVNTGKVVAISNLTLAKNGSVGEYKNYAIAEKSEPGSTFKTASVLALLEDGYATSQSIVDFSFGKKKFYGLWMYDSNNHGYAKSTLKEAFEISSNVGIASAMDEAYNKTKKWSEFSKRLRQFGLAQKTGIEIEGEPDPYVKDPVKNRKDWYNTTIPWMSHGYELSMTPLQLLTFYNAIANDGLLMKPYLVKEIRKDGKVLRKFKPESKGRIASKENIDIVQSMMEGVVERGTGHQLKSDRYRFAGKTGTTKVNYDKGERNYNASFAGFWPVDNPRYSMIVVIYGLKGSVYYGNQVAGPVFKRIMDWTHTLENGTTVVNVDNPEGVGKYRGAVHGFDDDFEKIFKGVSVSYRGEGRWVRGDAEGYNVVRSDPAKISTSVIPDVSGMGLRDAVYVLENLGMKVRVEGVGKVGRQSIRPGIPIDKQEIVLHLN